MCGTHGKSLQYHPRMQTLGCEKQWLLQSIFHRSETYFHSSKFVNIQYSYQKNCEISVKPKSLHKSSASYISVLELFHFHFVASIKHITAVSTRNVTSSKITSHKFYRRLRTGALRLVLHTWLMKFYMPEKWTS
jgi:hypothetical protein